MALMNAEQARCARAAVGLARLKAGKIQSFDQAVERLNAAQRELALREAGRQLRQADEQLSELQAVAEALEQLQKAGAYRAVVLEMLAANALRGPAAYVGLVGQPTQIVAGFLPKVDPTSLSSGDEVEVVRSGPDSFAVRSRVGRHVRFGAVARVDQVRDAELLRVTAGSEQYYLRPSAALVSEIASCDEETEVLGRFVSYEPQLGMAFAFFGEPERESLVLREVPSVKREELIVLPGVARALEEDILLPAAYPELAAAHGVEPARFLLFSGPPGVGKTHGARWIATALSRPVYLISGAEIADMWYGGTEAKLRARLEAACKEPDGAVVVWDEADAMLVERGRTLVGVENRVVSQMLSFTDGFESKQDVLVVLTTNRPDLMDNALLRALRARPLVFQRPDAPRTRELFELYLRDKPCADVDAALLAREATQAIFAERDPLAVLVLRDSSRVAVGRAAAVSGALVRAACEGAQRLAFVRHARAGGRGRPQGLLRDDLFAALDEQFARAAEHLTRDNVEAALTLPPDALGNVVAVERQRPSERHRFLLDPEPQPQRAQPTAAS
jgi:transitional endoplasmic reticulum ATPase